MSKKPVAAAFAILVALFAGSYAAKRLLEGSAATNSVIQCPNNAPGWQGHITGPRVTPSAPAKEQGILRGINTFRSANGLRRLRPDATLALAAREHSANMIARRYFSHDGPDGSFERRLAKYTPRSCIAENIAWGSGPYGTASGVVQAWKDSPGHRHVMLLPWVTRVGVGVETGTIFDTANATVATADFAG